MHTALQGAEPTLTDREMEVYLACPNRKAPLLEKEYDLMLARDLQSLASLGSTVADKRRLESERFRTEENTKEA